MDQNTNLNREKKLLIGLGTVAAILLGKLFYIQIIDDKYKIKAEANSVYYEIVTPPRGIIHDRTGKTLVGNKTCYDIMCFPKEVREFDTIALANVLDTTTDFVRKKVREIQGKSWTIGYGCVPLLRQVGVETYMRFTEVEYRYPGFQGQVRHTRDYPVNAGGNLLGYIQEVDADFIEKHPEYRAGDFAGRTGLESAREEELRGTKGYHIYLRDSRGRKKGSFQNGEMDKEAVPGAEITTTIDATLQEYGQMLMHGKRGSIVAIEPATGEILAMISSPGIDVNMLSDIGKHWSKISRDRNKPMFNRTVMASYPPGSVFKLVNGLIGLDLGVLTPSNTYPCSRGFTYSANHKLGCHGHRSPLNLEEAVMMSCNAYFCYVLRNILENRKSGNTEKNFDLWREYVLSFGFGRKLESDFPGELKGNIPTSEFYNKRYGKGHWRFATIVSLSIGQGEIGATPLQIANMAATVANRGYYYIPHIVKDSKDLKIDKRFHEKQYTKVDTVHFKKVIKGMWRAVNDRGAGGTANSAYVEGLDICGKTGTAQNPHGKDNSVFICFAPMNHPKIAIAAYVENAGWGGSWACPIASLMVEKYLCGEVKRADLEQRIVSTSFIK